MSVTEKDLLLPALYLISNYEGMNTSKLIKTLEAIYSPEGHDAEIISGRKDTFFSQKVRNLTGSHYSTNGMSIYTTKNSRGVFSLTKVGMEYLNTHKDDFNYLLNSDFTYKDKIAVTNKISKEKINNKVLVLDEDAIVSEGDTKLIKSKVKVRSTELRKAAIQIFSKSKSGLTCCVCGFDFNKKYGKRGKNYIEIHHEKPISQYEEEDINTTIKDAINNLKPVCANCHRMIHRYPKQLLSIKELKKIIEETKNDN